MLDSAHPMPSSDAKRRANQKYYNKKRQQREQRGEDRKRHINVWMRDSLINRLQRLTLESLANGTYPWRTLNECMSYLIERGLEVFSGDDTVSDMLPVLEHFRHIEQIKQQRRDAQAMLAAARTEVKELIAIKQEQAAATYFHATMDSARKLPDTEWSAWLIAEMQKEFPQLMKIAPRGVDLERSLGRRDEDTSGVAVRKTKQERRAVVERRTRTQIKKKVRRQR